MILEHRLVMTKIVLQPIFFKVHRSLFSYCFSLKYKRFFFIFWLVFSHNTPNLNNLIIITMFEENRNAMLWAVWHECPSGAQFTFNFYRHWDTLVVWDMGDGSGHFLHSKEGVTQGGPLAMIAYCIGVLPLIRELLGAHPRVTQPWYADDAGGGRYVPADIGTLPGPSGKGTGLRLLPGSDQEHLGRGPRECSPGRGALSGAGYLGGDGTQVPGGLHRVQRGGKELVEVEY